MFRRSFLFTRATATSVLLPVLGFAAGGCVDQKAKSRAAAEASADSASALAGDFFQPTEHWLQLSAGSGGLARFPRAGGSEALSLLLAAAQTPDDPRAFLPAAVPLPPVETAAPVLSWSEAQRLQAIETARKGRSAGQTAAATSADSRGAASAHRGTVHLSLQRQPIVATDEAESPPRDSRQ